MNELDRYAVSLENMEVLRAQVEALEAWKAEELAVMNPLMDYARYVCTGPLGCSLTEWLVEDHKAQAREIERLQLTCNDLDDQNDRIYAELAALKAQPSGVVLPERKPVEPLEFNRTTADVEAIAHNACLDEVARLNSSPASQEQG